MVLSNCHLLVLMFCSFALSGKKSLPAWKSSGGEVLQGPLTPFSKGSTPGTSYHLVKICFEFYYIYHMIIKDTPRNGHDIACSILV